MKIVNRWQAFLVHLGLSAIIFVVLLYLIVFVWYPQPYFLIDGGVEGVLLITGVDMVLGPTLTLIVYKAGKPGLKRDLGIIALVQLTALVWGTALVHGQRLAMVVHANDTFYTLNAEQVRSLGDKAMEIADQAEGLPYAFVRLPVAEKERREFIINSGLQGVNLYRHADRYEPFSPAILAEVQQYSLDLAMHIQTAADDRAKVERFLAKHGGELADYIFVPLIARYGEAVLALPRNQTQVLDTLDIAPWGIPRLPPETRKPSNIGTKKKK